MKNKIGLYSDLFFFLAFFPLMIVLVPVDRWLVYHPWFTVSLMFYLSGLYVMYRCVNIPGLLLRRKYLWGVGCVLVVLCATYLFTLCSGTLDWSDNPLKMARNRLQTQGVWFLTLTVTGYCFSNNLLTEVFRQSLSKQRAETEKKRAELALYKAQINPHFLFNTLNTLYGLLITRSEQTEASFEEFIDLVRYMYRNATREYIPVGEEVEYIGHYVALQSLRLNDRTKVTFQSDVENPAASIPPMLLITFVENAFKYGVSSDRGSFIRITMQEKGGRLLFTVENPVCVREHKDSEKMGIENCKKRLDLLYPHNHDLRITTDDGVYRVELHMNLTGT